ncbi:MAG: guanylate kinase [Halothiobacillaceae bacterium]|nr:guanylate kinase [Halothiobacillaceae bacterium]MDY0049300.1 guanylate kinase [Halothiobacillaceae bacterium]
MAKGNLFIISAPSGAGKTSLVKALLQTTPGVNVSISHTTRGMRPGEVNGGDYHFVTTATFEEMSARGEFLEHACVFDNHYGTAKSSVELLLASGSDVILEIDWQGARQVKARMPDALTVFILPPSREALLERLRKRGQDDEIVIARRMRDAVAEISHHDEFEYLIVNDVFDMALHDLQGLIRTQRLRSERQKVAQRALLRDLLD